MSKVFVKYGLIFDPDQAWSSLKDFEMDLALILKQKGLKAELVETIDNQEEMIIVYVSKDEQIVAPEDDTSQREKVINGKRVRSS